MNTIVKISLISVGALALILIAYFVYKNKKDKKENEVIAPEVPKEVITADETKETQTASFVSENLQNTTLLNAILKKGSEGKQVEQLQYWLEKKYKEQTGQVLKFNKLGIFDDTTEQFLNAVTGKPYMNIEDFKKKRIDSYKTYKIK